MTCRPNLDLFFLGMHATFKKVLGKVRFGKIDERKVLTHSATNTSYKINNKKLFLRHVRRNFKIYM